MQLVPGECSSLDPSPGRSEPLRSRRAYSTYPTDLGILQEEEEGSQGAVEEDEGVMRRRWRCKVEEEYLDLWTSEEERCGGDGGR